MAKLSRRLWVVGGLAAAIAAPAAQRWQKQYLYDQAKTEMDLEDIAFPSATRGIAVGIIHENGQHRKPVALTTADGGATWSQTNLEDAPGSLFFLNDSLGWMVGEKGGIWQTTEAGRDWHKLPKPPVQLLRVHFFDENRGIGAGAKKSVLETSDGGKKWTPIAEAAKPPGAPERSAYNWIAFANPMYGLVTGFNQPIARWGSMFPAWLDPQDALSRREIPHMSYTLSTTDGGKTWTSNAASLLGHITRVRLMPNGSGLGLIEYTDSFRVPSQVDLLDWKTGKSRTVFRDKRYGITDVWLTASGTAYLAGIAIAGEVRSLVPSRIVVLRSENLTDWTEMPVDYRAIAQRAIFAGAGGEDLWLATNNGMILRLN
jgi:hypothetical protein